MQFLEKTLSDPRFGYAFVGSLLFATALFGVPDLAFASVADDINGWLCGLLRDTCSGAPGPSPCTTWSTESGRSRSSP